MRKIFYSILRFYNFIKEQKKLLTPKELKNLWGKIKKNPVIILKVFFSTKGDGEYIKYRVLFFCGKIKRMSFYTFFYRKLKKKIVFSNFVGNGYGCNPKYIAEEIHRRGLPYKLIWLAKKKMMNDFPSYITPVEINTHQAFKELATAKIWVDNQKKVPLLRLGMKKRSGQTFIQTWHGSLGIKRLKWTYNSLLKQDSKMTDYLLTNSDFEDEVLPKALNHKNEIIRYGHPRNDIFFLTKGEQKEIREKICKTFSLNADDKFILYAPTYRDDYNVAWGTVDFNMILNAFEKKWPNHKYTILCKFHPKQIVKTFNQKDFVNVSTYQDMQELLVAADYIITDYSSCIFDFIISRKPGFIYASDIKTYDTRRGFYYPMKETPFPIAKNNKELEYNIKNFDQKEYVKKVDAFFQKKGWFEDGQASKRVVDLIEKIMNNKKNDDKEKCKK